MRDGDSALKWVFLGATEPERGPSDYYEEFGVPKHGARLRVRPHDTGEWRSLAVRVLPPDRPVPTPDTDVTRAISWLKDRLSERLI